MPIAVFASAALALAIQAQPVAAPSRAPGIAESPQSRRLPSPVTVHAEPADRGIERDLRAARREVDRRRKSGEITRREARDLRREIRVVGNLAERYGSDGLSASERRELEMHARAVKQQSAVRGSI